MAHVENPVGRIVSGIKNVATAGTQVQLATNPTPCSWVVITPDPGNAGNVYIGDADVSSTTGVVLAATAAPLTLAVNDASLVWVDAANSDENVSFIYGV